MATKPPFLDDNTTTRLGERTAREGAEREDTTGDPPPPDKETEESPRDKGTAEDVPTIEPPAHDTTAGQDDATDDGNVDDDQHLEFGESGAIFDGAIRERVDDDQFVNVPDDDMKGSEGDISTGVRVADPPPLMGHPVSKPPGQDPPDSLFTPDGPPPVDPDGGTTTIASAFGPGTKGEVTADATAQPLIGNLAGTGTREAPVEIVDDGDKPPEEGSVVEQARAGLADLRPDEFASLDGFGDLASTDDGTEDARESLFGPEPGSDNDVPGMPGERSGEGGSAGSESLSGSSSSSSDSSYSHSPSLGFPEVPGQPPGDGSWDFSGPSVASDTSLTGGVPVRSEGGEVRVTEGQKQLAKDYEGTWLDDTARAFNTTNVGAAGDVARESGKDVDEAHTSADGTVSSTKYADGTVVVTNTNNNTTTTLNPDGSSVTKDLTTGKVIDESDPSQPKDDNVLTPEEEAALRAELAPLEAHRGSQNDPGTETQPTEDDPGFGVGTGSGLSPGDAHDMVHDKELSMLGQPGPGDIDFGGGGHGGGQPGDEPNSGTIDPTDDADQPPHADGPEQDPFDRQQDTLEPSAADSDESDSDSDGDAGLLVRTDLRENEPADDLRATTLDAA